MFIEIKSLDEFNQLKQKELALLAYFSTDACNVCKVLKPKVDELVQSEFPQLKMVYVKSDVLPDIAGQHQVFTAPTILVFFDGRETIRKSRNIGLDELRREIDRPYSMIFPE
ncbi:MAG TPA: thioredoxin family protein [Tangfeifania sp.]|nr:thioredoxin family protein [Tangfeifania sp.]